MFAADEVSGLFAGRIIELEHEAELQMLEGAAKLVVQRTVYNESDREDEVVIDLDIPSGAVVVGVRTKTHDSEHERWYKGTLLTSDAAEESYWKPGSSSRVEEPRTLLAQQFGSLRLRVFPVPALSRLTLEYTMLVPTEYQDGSHVLKLASCGTEALPWRVRLQPGTGVLRARVVGTSERGEVVSTPRYYVVSKDELEVSWSPKVLPRISLEVGRLGQGAQKFEVTSLRLGQLSEVPQEADVVFVLDCSFSMTDEELAVARHAMIGYLDHVPNAKVQVVTFSRHASAVFLTFLPAAEAQSRLDALRPAKGNGTNLVAAVGRASELLATRTSSDKRVVLLSDFNTATDVSPTILRGVTQRAGAVVHFVATSWSQMGRTDVAEVELEPAYDNPWFRATELTHGAMWYLDELLSAERSLAKVEMRSKILELVRPTRIHGLSLDVGTRNVVTLDALREGDGLRKLAMVQRPWGQLKLSGRVWGRKIEMRASPSSSLAKTWSALIFSTEFGAELSEREQLALALRAGAVTQRTSYVSTSALSRPPPKRLAPDDKGFAHGINKWSSVDRRSGISCSFPQPRPDYAALVRPKLEAMWRKCNGQGKAQVVLESTLDEVVLVRVVPEVPESAKLSGACLTEAIWNIRLPVVFLGEAFQRVTVPIRG